MLNGFVYTDPTDIVWLWCVWTLLKCHPTLEYTQQQDRKPKWGTDIGGVARKEKLGHFDIFKEKQEASKVQLKAELYWMNKGTLF